METNEEASQFLTELQDWINRVKVKFEYKESQAILDEAWLIIQKS